MHKDYSIAEARNQFAAIVHDLKITPSIQLTRRGKPVAVLLSIEEYERLVAGRTGFWESYELFRKSGNLNALDIDPSIIFEGVRDPAPGRELAW